MRRSTKWLMAAVIAAFLIIVIANLPAALAARWLPATIHVAALEGTLWHGQALGVQAGAFDIERLEWRLHPVQLLGGSFAAHIEAANAADRLTADVVMERNGRIAARAVEGRMNAATFAGRALPIGWSGPVTLHFAELVIVNGWVAQVRGTAESGTLSGPPAVQPYLGSYSLNFASDANATAGELLGHFRDTGGPIEITGDVRLYRDRRAVVSGWVRARPGAPAGVVADIAKLPEVDPQGRRRFSIENNF